jgi:hypothetical protein
MQLQPTLRSVAGKCLNAMLSKHKIKGWIRDGEIKEIWYH